MSNALAQEKSPYLRQHAENPVDWLPWGEAAFAKARAEQKPIFLSIGYSTCHWCHVMAHESFENEATAALLNAHFVPVKVDREERPDVDRVYMSYVQAVTGQGGWPLSVWLTPELKPFFGGTYFPPEERHGRPGFPSLLRALAKGWAEEKEKVLAEGDRVIELLREHLAGAPTAGGAAGDDLAEAAEQAMAGGFQYFHENYDAGQGGFGGAPKFPRASNLHFLLRCAVAQGAESDLGKEAVKMAGTTLRKMSAGGIHDHVGGGFHRYSVDAGWRVPHFDKMLYDQAQVAVNLLDAHLVTGDEQHARVARDVCDYVLRDLAHPEGGFYSAEDADSPTADGQAEGAFYVWTEVELQEALGGDAEFFCTHFGVREGGNVPAELDPSGEFRGKNILYEEQTAAATGAAHGLGVAEARARLERCLARLREARARRPRPSRDDKIVTAWNGLMISALARAGTSAAVCLVDRRAAYLAAAVKAAEFLRRELYDEARGVLFRSYREGRGASEGFAEDYACLIAGLVDLYEVTFDIGWLQWADRLQETMDRLFYDETGGGYFNTAAGDPHLVLRLKEDYDGAEPAPGSIAVANLARLAVARPDDKRRERARRTARAAQAVWAQTPQALPELLCALEWLLAPPRQVVIAGNPRAEDFQALAAAVRATPGPQRGVLAADGGEGQAWLAECAPEMAAMRPLNGRARAYVCEDFACQAPVTEPEALRELLCE